ncbi:MAG: hypothetical protein U0872_12590 [Planctomycetaceae bacterium]
MTALTAHLWVSMVIAPWHRLTEHRLVAGEPAANQSAQLEEIKAVRGCACHRHSHQTQPCAPADSRGNSSESPVHDHDNCEVCQVLSQHYQPVDVPAPQLAPERTDFSRTVVLVQPLLGCLTDPVSRGPPAA